MSDIAYYDIKEEARRRRLSDLKQLRNNQSRSLQKSIRERGDENSDLLKDLLKKNNDIINKESDDIQRIITHLNYLITITNDDPKHHLSDMSNEIQILTTRLP
jgi:CRISPR/Cas system-associated endoribonuclease Cas2